MKKTNNMSNIAYIRRSVQLEPNKQASSNKGDPKQQLSKAIFQQMGKNQTEYLQKLIQKTKNQDIPHNLPKCSQIHHQIDEEGSDSEYCETSPLPIQKYQNNLQFTLERTHQPAVNTSQEIKGKDQLYSHRGQKNKSVVFEKYYSGSNTPVSQKNQHYISQSTFTNYTVNQQQRQHCNTPKQGSLIQSIDDYILKLDKQIRNQPPSARSPSRKSLISPKQIKNSYKSKSKSKEKYNKYKMPIFSSRSKMQKKMVGDSVGSSMFFDEDAVEKYSHDAVLQQNDYTHTNKQSVKKNFRVQTELLQKLQKVNSYAKTLKLSNQILENQNRKLQKKQHKMKQKMYSMLEHIKDLTASLEKERYQRKKAQKFFKEIQVVQKKFVASKQTSRINGYKQYYQQQLLLESMNESQSTEHNDTLQNICSEESEETLIPHLLQNTNINTFHSTKKPHRKPEPNKKITQLLHHHKDKCGTFDINSLFQN